MVKAFELDKRIRNVWHPSPAHTVIHTPNGSINVFEGSHRVQINTGEFIEI